MAYRLRISREVQRQIERVPGNMRQRVRHAIAELADDPRPDTAKQMEAELSNYYRLRLGDYRIIYTIDDDIVVVEVIRVVKRTPKTYWGLG
jgi:mRNA interferase RelE/StbE